MPMDGRFEYDYLIVGSGLYGSVFAHELTKCGKRCLVIEKRSHIGGNIYTECVDGINVHKYGAHIFHTSNKKIWDYINQFAEFNNFINAPIAIYGDEIYNLPFNMNTFNKLWGVKTPQEAKRIIEQQISKTDIKEPRNLEEKALCTVGTDIYEKLIKGYTEKQWGRKCSELPMFIIGRLPLRFTYNNNYFKDLYQGVPVGGYTQIAERLLDSSEVLLDTDYFEFIKQNENIAEKTVYTGMLDEYFSYRIGHLQWRSLRFETEQLGMENYQGNAVINYTDRQTPYTRIIEHKHFEFGNQPNTVITYEYPMEWAEDKQAYYPINDERNTSLADEYLMLAEKEKDVIFGGRLGRYKYYDMDKVIEAALDAVAKETEYSGQGQIRQIP